MSVTAVGTTELIRDDSEELVRADLTHSHTCTAAGITAQGTAPVLIRCRQLLAAGLDPDQALHVYRGATLAFSDGGDR